jgi:hypothetical protein
MRGREQGLGVRGERNRNGGKRSNAALKGGATKEMDRLESLSYGKAHRL